MKLLKLKDPHGKSEWNGAWSYTSKEWTLDTLDKCKFNDSAAGAFCIPYDAYVKLFDSTSFSMTLGPNMKKVNVMHSFA